MCRTVQALLFEFLWKWDLGSYEIIVNWDSVLLRLCPVTIALVTLFITFLIMMDENKMIKDVSIKFAGVWKDKLSLIPRTPEILEVFFFYAVPLLWFFSSSLIWKNLPERWGGRRKEIVLLISQVATMSKGSPWGICIVAGVQIRGPSSPAFLSHEQGAGLKVEQPGLELITVWNAGTVGFMPQYRPLLCLFEECMYICNLLLTELLLAPFSKRQFEVSSCHWVFKILKIFVPE